MAKKRSSGRIVRARTSDEAPLHKVVNNARMYVKKDTIGFTHNPGDSPSVWFPRRDFLKLLRWFEGNE